MAILNFGTGPKNFTGTRLDISTPLTYILKVIKKYLPFFAVGMIGGVLAFLVISVFDDNDSVNIPSPSLSTTPLTSDSWQNIVSNESLSSVTVQSFLDSKLLRQASGIVLSVDGLIMTTADTVASGGNFQALVDDKILRATEAARDYTKNLAILKVGAEDLNVADLDEITNLTSGQEFIITGKFVSLSKTVVFSQKALINYVLDKDIVLDTVYNSILNGAKVVDENGRMAGMAYARGGKIHMINSKLINEFLSSQLNKK